MNEEQAQCNFCKEVKPVSRKYIRVKNKWFDDNKQGCYFVIIFYCKDCGVED